MFENIGLWVFDPLLIKFLDIFIMLFGFPGNLIICRDLHNMKNFMEISRKI